MGPFSGHILPAMMAMLLGIRWTITAINRHFRSLNSLCKKPSLSQISSSWCFPKLPSEGIVILFLGTAGIVVHILYGLIHHGDIHKEGEHITLYVFYGNFGLVSILKFYRFPLPPSSDFAAFLLAITMETLALAFHLQRKDPLGQHVHILLILILVSIFFVTLNEAYNRTCAIWSIARGISLTLHGTWLAQIAFSMYLPSATVQLWHQDNHEGIMKATNIFSLHVALNMMFAGLIGCKFWMQRRKTIDSSLVDNEWIGECCNKNGHVTCNHNDEFAKMIL